MIKNHSHHFRQRIIRNGLYKQNHGITYTYQNDIGALR